MKIKISKDYWWKNMGWEFDSHRYRQGEQFTQASDYNPVFEEVEVTQKELLDYIKKGYAIKINC